MYLRILQHGKVNDLSKGFELPGYEPFSICVVPKSIQPNTGTTVNCRLVCDSEPSDIPVVFNDWSPALIQFLEPNSIDLSQYDVYWGAGNIN